ncbi:(d)CMP kinase [Marinigracilibium pacificum]|uniref:Cytidylate kinase n=1 Tax=Marinigracilibium pacificum TaxID=2729599 RepID=A0A848J3P2_9BACT|nr:(d)CMP kinase [Marinigracilibium pacificum]NMM49104.1 (d)CMP kinase [Marinigracilibium pacificum]
MKKINIAIDGYSACGKSSTAKIVASRLEYKYIDSGAMYRAVTLYFIDNYVDLTNDKKVDQALENINIDFRFNSKKEKSETYLNGLNVEDEIRTMKVTNMVSEVSALPKVRKVLVELQQKLGKKKGVVMDGRDIGSVVLPDAELKVFMTADKRVRALRRQQELLEKEQLVDLDEIIENLTKRDNIDTSREVGPLIKVDEAIEIDTTHITLEEQVEEILNEATSRMVENQ